MYLKAYANDMKGSKLWQLSACKVITFHKYIQCFLQAENRVVLIQVWLKSIEK